MSNQYSAIILCAGSGSRSGLGYNKVLYMCEGKPLFVYAVMSFVEDPRCSQVIIVTKPDERDQFKKEVASEKVMYVDGGSERSESVENAINYVTESKVLIHDAARRGVDQTDLHELCNMLDTCDAALLGLPIVDTVKRVVNQRVIGTEDRSTLYLGQTPQAFHVEMLKEFITQAKRDQYMITDEIMLVEQYQSNANIQMLKGSKKYNKWTYAEDFGGKICFE